MKVTRKLTLAFAFGVAVVLGLVGYFETQREIATFERDIRRDHHVLANALASAAAEVLRLEGEREAADVVAHANIEGSPIAIRWITTNPAPGVAATPGVPPTVREALRTSDETQLLETATGGSLLTFHVVSRGQRPAWIELKESLREQESYVHTTVINVAATSLAVGLLCILIAHVLGASIVGRPVQRLVAKARQVGRGSLEPPLDLPQGDELGMLAREMNAMCDNLANARRETQAETAQRIAVLEQLRHADRLATLGKLSAGVAHELGTPLNVVSGRAKLIEAGELDVDETRDSARIIAQQAERMSNIIRQLLDFARQKPAQKSDGDLLSLVREALNLLRPLAAKRGVTLRLASDTPVEASFSRAQLLQAVMNLVVNAIQASPQGSSVCVEVDTVQRSAPAPAEGQLQRWARIRVVDEGAGIPPEVSERVFEPFFTTKGVGEGTGLGLSVSYGIVQDHCGWIDVHSAVGQGSEFAIHLAAQPRNVPLRSAEV